MSSLRKSPGSRDKARCTAVPGRAGRSSPAAPPRFAASSGRRRPQPLISDSEAKRPLSDTEAYFETGLIVTFFRQRESFRPWRNAFAVGSPGRGRSFERTSGLKKPDAKKDGAGRPLPARPSLFLPLDCGILTSPKPEAKGCCGAALSPSVTCRRMSARSCRVQSQP